MTALHNKTLSPSHARLQSCCSLCVAPFFLGTPNGHVISFSSKSLRLRTPIFLTLSSLFLIRLFCSNTKEICTNYNRASLSSYALPEDAEGIFSFSQNISNIDTNNPAIVFECVSFYVMQDLWVLPTSASYFHSLYASHQSTRSIETPLMVMVIVPAYPSQTEAYPLLPVLLLTLGNHLTPPGDESEALLILPSMLFAFIATIKALHSSRRKDVCWRMFYE